jgi:hypothetical protein
MTDSDKDSLELDHLAAQLPALRAALNVGGSATGVDGTRDPSELQGMSRRNVGIMLRLWLWKKKTQQGLRKGKNR